MSKPLVIQRKNLRQSNRALYTYLNESCGIPIRDARTAVQGLTLWLTATLCSGKPVTLHTFGSFAIRIRKGRTMKNNYGTHVMPDSRYIRFHASDHFRARLNPKTKTP